MPTTNRTPYPTEWFHNKNGVQHYWTEEDVAAAERHQAKRGDIITDVQNGGRNGGLMTVIRATPAPPTPKPALKRCEMCGGEYMANVPRQRYCSKTCGNRMSKLRRKAATA